MTDINRAVIFMRLKIMSRPEDSLLKDFFYAPLFRHDKNDRFWVWRYLTLIDNPDIITVAP